MPEPTANSASNAATVDLTGRQLGDYRLLRRLGRGGMAEVYLADQSSLGRKVALKVLRPDLADDETYVKRFELEARAAAALVHASIVQIYEVGHVDGVHFIAQEYVAGQNLAELLARSGPPAIPVAVGIMRQVAAALAKAAERGIVHRDIKPENLMLSTGGEVKVADFGLARATHSGDQLNLTQVGVTMGSPLYMSPEQVQGKPLDTRSDIYSFGVTCYQMLAGQPPFIGDTPLGVAVQHLKSEPERLENLRPDLPPGLCRIVHQMLSKDPQHRFANGAEVLRELRTLEIDGLTGDWPDDLEYFNTSETVALSSARSAATRQLAALMSETTQNRSILRQKFFWIGLAGAFLFGILLAWPRAERSLLEDGGSTASGVKRMKTAEEQYFYAMSLGTEESWQAVLEYHDDENYARLSKKQLADAYLNQDRFDEALELFAELASLGDAEPEFFAYGLAGQYVVLALQGEREKAADKFAQFAPLRGDLQRYDPRMTRRVYQLARKNHQASETQLDQEMDDWLRRHVETDPSALDG